MRLRGTKLDRESKAGLGLKKTFIAALIAFLAGAVTFTFVGDNSGPKKFVEKNQVKINILRNFFV